MSGNMHDHTGWTLIGCRRDTAEQIAAVWRKQAALRHIPAKERTRG